MRVGLQSNFVDYYDHYMDILDIEVMLNRKTTAGPNRIDMFICLEAMGFHTPHHGMVKDIYKGIANWTPGPLQDNQTNPFEQFEVVVYTDLNAHCGEGKEKLMIKEAHEKYPDHFASVWYRTSHTKQIQAQTLRMLAVGRKTFWLLYRSADDWRSNAGTVEITQAQVPGMNAPKLDHLAIPLFAVDFLPVGGNWGNLLAVDLNIAPGIKGTPVQDLLKAEDAAALIKDRMAEIYGKI